LESYTGITESINGSSDEIVPFTPFTFSAVSETALVSLLKAYSNYLKAESNTNIRDLAWTLQSRRSVFPVKVSFSGINLKHLASKIDTKLEEAEKNPETPIGLRVAPGEARVLGIFTGQGAQWATMGGDLIRSSTFVCDRIKHLDESLAALPETDRPAWLISTELLANKSCSRIGEAELSQPLCTAIQIILVDLLQAAGLKFSAVVGHSSGEIAAAYAAGFISDHDAIRIAYYRGLNAKQASLHGCKGAMLAVGTSLEDAQQLCELPEYKSRLCVAAHNSSASITLSGDVDAIEQAKSTFKEKNTFVRQLMVDTAYHSHHMLPFGDAYIESLRGAKINVNTERKSKCVWYSSVVPGKVMEPTEDLRDTYWRDNLVKPVMFAEAVTEAAKTNITMGIEIGPHPALKAPG
jgi:hybrid polyketide synthase/nonribosomal peptide synthetase ACE1